MRRILLPLLLLLHLIALTGCWSRKEINELAVLVAIGIDWEGGAQPYRVTYQVARPAALVRGGGAQGGGKGPPVEVLSAVGQTAIEAARYMQRGTPRRYYAQHCEVYVIGEQLARHGIGPLLDVLTRDPLIRPSTLVLVSKGPAREVMRYGQDLEATLGETVTGLIRFRSYTAATMRMTVNDLARVMSQVGRQPVIPGLRIDRRSVDLGKPVVFLEDAAMFKGDRMVGWLSGETSQGLLWLHNLVGRGTITVPCPGEPGRFATADLIRGRSRQEAAVVQGRPVVVIHVDLESELLSQTCRQDLSSDKGLALIEAGQRAHIAAVIERAVAKAKAVKSDVLGFGESFHETQPGYWHRVAKGWDAQVFPQVEAKIAVEAHVRRAGMVTSPGWSARPGKER